MIHVRLHPSNAILRAAARALLLASGAAAALAAGCAKSRFEPPAAIRAGSGAQIEEAKRLASAAQRADDEGRIEEAIDLYRRAIATYREFPGAWLNLGTLLMKNKQNIEAVEAFKVAADLSPTDPAPLFNIGVLWEQLGWLHDASKYYNEALQREPGYLNALRRSVHLDMLQDTASEVTLERLKRAMTLETDPNWKTAFDLYKRRIEQKLRPSRESVAG